MYCTQCGTFFPGYGDKCPSCKAAEQNSSSKQSFWERINKKRLAIVLCILLLIPIGIILYNNSGSYVIRNHNIEYQRIEYHGTLEKLVNDDYSLLDDFLDGNVDGERNVRAIYCNDYTLELVRYGYGGMVDIVDDNITFYESGLREYNEAYYGNSYDRFRDDFVFVIKKLRSSRQYYFQNLSDVAEWLKRNF